MSQYNTNLGSGIMQGYNSVMGPKIERQQKMEDEARSQRLALIYKALDTQDITRDEVISLLGQAKDLYKGYPNVQKMLEEGGNKLLEFHDQATRNSAAAKTIPGPEASRSAATGTNQVPSLSQPQNTINAGSEPGTSPNTESNTPPAGTVYGNGLVKPPNPAEVAASAVGMTPPVRGQTNNQSQTSATPQPTPTATTAIPPTAHMARSLAGIISDNSNPAKAAAMNRGVVSESMDFWKSKIPDIDDNAAYNMSVGKNVLPTAFKMGGKYIGDDGYEYTKVVMPDMSIKEIKSDHKVQEKTFQVKIGRPLSVTNAKELSSNPNTPDFLDSNGNTIDLDKLSPDMALYPVFQGNKTHYVIQSQRQPSVTVGGKVYAVPEFEKINMPQGSATELGTAPGALPKSTSREQLGVDAEGNPVAITMRGASVTNTPGVNQVPGAEQKPGATGTIPIPQTKPKGVSGGSKSTTSTTPLPSGSRPVSGMPTALYNQWIARIIPVREASNQIFGDPSQPAFKGLINYADLANNPESAQRVGAAVEATLNSINQDEKTHGSLVNLLKMYGGIPQALVNAKINTMSSLIPTDPTEHAAYVATINAYSNMVGLRSLTKAGAYEFSTKAIQNDLPILGKNVHNSKQFYGMLTKLAEDVWGGARVIPKGMIPEDERTRYQKQVAEIAAKSGGGVSNVIPSPGSRGSGGSGTGHRSDNPWAKPKGQ